MAFRHPLHARHTPVALFAEGASEHGYGRWLGGLARKHGVPLALRIERLQGGDPLELVSAVAKELKSLKATAKIYHHRGVLLDADLLGKNHKRDAEALLFAKRDRLHLIWQTPCHEAFLLRHFPGRDNDKPPTCQEAMERLRKEWPDYEKGLDGIAYGEVLTMDHLARARGAETALDEFLVRIGWN